MGENKKPVQARSIQTKENLLKAALAMYAKKGYYKTTVDEIAAEAGLSTGIAYRYFRNKKEILLSAIRYGAENIGSFVRIEPAEDLSENNDLCRYLRNVLIGFEELHAKYHDIHEELEGLQHTDEDVRKLYNKITAEQMENVIGMLRNMFGDAHNLREKAYFVISIMEQYCHMKMNREDYELDFDVMRELTVNTVRDVLTGRGHMHS